MLSKKRNWKNSLFNQSLEEKVDFYFGFFLSRYIIIVNYEREIKHEILKEFQAYLFCDGRTNEGLRSIKQLASELGHLTGAWNFDWAWIIHHIILDFKNIGIFQSLTERLRTQKVYFYKYVPEKYYEFAREIYLNNLSTQEPKLFEPKELFENGTGLIDNTKKFKPVVGATLWRGFNNEYWDLTELKTITDDHIWDVDKKMFILKPHERKFERRSKITITIGDKKFEV